MHFVVERAKWMRGRGDGTGRMMSAIDGSMCCLGFCALQLGASADQIRGKMTPSSAMLLFPELVDSDGTNNSFSAKAWDINDRSTIGDLERERQLIALFERHGHTIEFK